MSDRLNDLCQQGQTLLVRTQYLQAVAALVEADALATSLGDYDTLARLYMPLQEARRQIRQRSGEGIVRLDIVARSDADAAAVVERYPHGQLLVAGPGSVAPAAAVRRLAAERGLYLETLLGATYPLSGGGAVTVIVPDARVALPPPEAREIDRLLPLLPAHAIVLSPGEIMPGEHAGSAETFAAVSHLWERLHRPFLAAADAVPDARRRIDAYRRVIDVDYACEFAHQRLSFAARDVARCRVGDRGR